MGYYVTCQEVEFKISYHNIGKAIETLVESKYFYLNRPKELCLDIGRMGSKEEQQALLYELLDDNGYVPEYDPDGNVIGLTYENEKWFDDTYFFDVFADCVEKGSYIEMAGEDGQLWRMLFDGEHCIEVNPVILWPDATGLSLMSNNISDFQIVRQIQGTSVSIPLTSDELYQAYITKEHDYDIADICDELDSYNVKENTRKDFYDLYGIDLSDVLNQPELIEKMAYTKRKNQDKYGMEWTDARDDAIKEVLRNYQEKMSQNPSLNAQIQLALEHVEKTYEPNETSISISRER